MESVKFEKKTRAKPHFIIPKYEEIFRRRRAPTAAGGDSLDWKGISAEEITKRVTGKVTSGSIVLFHNAGEHTPEALPDILDYLLAEGYEIVPISRILLRGEYTIDHTGRQCPAESLQ